MQPTTDPSHPLAQHPAFIDVGYRARRDQLAALARAEPLARIDYTPVEHDTWAAVRRRIDPLHARHGCAAVRHAARRVPLHATRIPQLADVSAALTRASGFRLRAVEGLVAPRPFFAALAEGTFLATQYVRHPATPLYTPEPDVIHELVGHVALLADPQLAALARSCGRVAACADDDTLVRIARVFWYTLEFGLCVEEGQPRALGAGLLSSVGELEHAMDRSADGAQLCAWDPEAMAALPYDTQGYQPRLFVAPSLAVLIDDVRRWLATATARPGRRA